MQEVLAIEALKSAFRDYKQHSGAFILTAALLATPTLLAAMAETFVHGAAGTATSITLQIVAGVTTGVVLPVAVIGGTRRSATGHGLSLREILNEAFSHPGKIWRYFLTFLLVFLIILAIVLVALIPTAGAAIAALRGSELDLSRFLNSGVGVVVLMIFLVSILGAIAAAYFVLLAIALWGQIVVLEGEKPAQSLRRSRQLTKGRRVDIFLLWLILGAIGSVVYLLVAGPALVLNYRASLQGEVLSFFAPRPLGKSGMAAALLTGVSTYLLQVLWAPFTNAAMTNYYLLIRAREPYDPRSSGNRFDAYGSPSYQSHGDTGQQQYPSGQYQDPGNLGE